MRWYGSASRAHGHSLDFGTTPREPLINKLKQHKNNCQFQTRFVTWQRSALMPNNKIFIQLHLTSSSRNLSWFLWTVANWLLKKKKLHCCSQSVHILRSTLHSPSSTVTDQTMEVWKQCEYSSAGIFFGPPPCLILTSRAPAACCIEIGCSGNPRGLSVEMQNQDVRNWGRRIMELSQERTCHPSTVQL